MKRSFPVIPTIITFIVLIILSFWVGLFLNKEAAIEVLQKTQVVDSRVVLDSKLPSKEALDFTELWEVWNVLQKKMYLEETVDPQKIMYGMIQGMVASIGDDYTVFLDPSETTDFEIAVNGKLSGIGAEIGRKHGIYYIAEVIKNTPAFKSGLKANDVIIEVDGKIAKDMEFKPLIESIRGEKGTVVTLKVIRPSTGDALTFEITRDDITVPSVDSKMIDGEIGYIELSQFSPRTADELKNAIDKLLGEGMKKLILDLRDNGGGYLDQAGHVVSAFIQEGNVIQRQYADGSRDSMPVSGRLLLDEKVPMAILINGYSASASEITAGTLQDYKRAIIVGETSFGKGTVQDTSRFRDGALIKYTISKWLTGEGNDIHKKGIVPDYEVKVEEKDNEEDTTEKPDIQLEKAIELLKKS